MRKGVFAFKVEFAILQVLVNCSTSKSIFAFINSRHKLDFICYYNGRFTDNISFYFPILEHTTRRMDLYEFEMCIVAKVFWYCKKMQKWNKLVDVFN